MPATGMGVGLPDRTRPGGMGTDAFERSPARNSKRFSN